MCKLKHSQLILLSLALLLTLSVLSAAALLRTPGSLNHRQTQVFAAADDEPLKNIRFTIYDVGIYPQEMQLDAGRFGIVFDDRTGRSTGFLVQRITGNSTQVAVRINAVADHPRTRGQVRLTPGSYRISSFERPEIFSTLIVNP